MFLSGNWVKFVELCTVSSVTYNYSEGLPVFAAVHLVLVCNVWECEIAEPYLTASVAF